LLAVLVGSFTAWACNIPVFRYARERWAPDAYQLVVFHRGSLTPAEEALVKALKKWAAQTPVTPNVEVKTCDLAGKVGKEYQQLWDAQTKAQTPWLVAVYPLPGVARTAWAGLLTPENVPGLLDSPVRRELAGRLLKGESIIWVLLESGRAEEDRQTAAWVKAELAKLEKEIKLPKPDGPEEDVPPSERLRSGLALRLTLPLVRLSRGAPEERIFTQMLLNLDEDFTTAATPVLFPVFGKGRLLCGFSGKDLTRKNVADAAEFLCGSCSCTVKQENPGVDLLFSAGWSEYIGGRYTLDETLPDLIGLGSLASNPAVERAAPTHPPPSTPPSSTPPPKWAAAP
jgi:hypothetical protein